MDATIAPHPARRIFSRSAQPGTKGRTMTTYTIETLEGTEWTPFAVTQDPTEAEDIARRLRTAGAKVRITETDGE